MAMLKPKIAVLDETDSGLDIDALRIVADGVKALVGPDMGALLITHYQRILNYITPDFVHVFVGGRIVEEGGPELAHKLEAKGYEAFIAGGGVRSDATADEITEVVAGIGNDYKYGFHEKEDYFFKSGRGLTREVVAKISEQKNEPQWMRDFAAEGARALRGDAAADAGAAHLEDIDFDDIYYYIKPTEKQADVVGGRPAGHQEHLRQARDPRGRAQVPRRRRRPVRVRGRLPQAPGGPRDAGRALPRHGLGAARARGHRQGVLRHGHPARTTTSSRR